MNLSSSHSIHDSVNAALFESLAIRWSEEIFSTRDVVIMAGGTGLYIKAFRDGLDEIPAVSEAIRRDIQQRYQAEGLDWLKDAIRLSDPLFYATGEISNPQRLMRALEVIKSTGRSILAFRNQQKKKNPFRILEFGIRQPRKELYHRIDHRVDQMMDSGLLEEVKSLIPYQHLNALQTVGYKELFDHLNGKMNLNDSVSLVKQNSRRYAKRQLTWGNSQEDLIWLEDNFFDRILEAYTLRNQHPI